MAGSFRTEHMSISTLLVTCYLFSCATAHLRVVGNLAKVATPLGHIGYEDIPLRARVGQLWCGVQNLGEDVPVHFGQFTRLRDGKVFEGVTNEGKAYLDVGRAPATVAGKYRCEVRTDEGVILSGNSFIYLPPVILLPSGSDATEVEDARPPRVKGTTHLVPPGTTLSLRCPVFAYPPPFVRWEKDGQPIDTSSVNFDGNDISVPSTTMESTGNYTCIADNSFPLFVDGPAMPHSLVYEQTVLVQ